MRGRTARIRCRVCGESLLVSGESAETETTSSEESPPASSPSPAEVRTSAERISEDTSRMGRMSFENTAPMEDVSELRALAQRMTPSYGEASSPRESGPVESPPPAAQFSSKTTMPMFGNAGAKPAEAAAPASTPPASKPSGSMPAVPPAPESNPSTGARNSTSILFSLAALAEKERSQVVTIGPRSEKELAAVPAIDGECDHSGLIDLHRLMPSGSKLSVQLVKPVSSSEPPLAVTRDVPKPAPRTGRVVVFAVLGLFLLVGVAFGMRSALKWAATKDASRLAAAQAAAMQSSPPAAPAPNEEEPKLDSLVPAPPPAAEVTAAASEATVTKAVKSKSRKHRHGSRRSKAAQAPTEAPAPSNDPCHCNGDLACAMRCASRN
ncbi:hypothetical protein LZC95_43700 [Pendulispora brunnea]|uniref:Uncharacterized protein n=2 Tax=Pendulispora brunnea TaxID=2905690 RepID=A0ABZ2K3R7_9BACT